MKNWINRTIRGLSFTSAMFIFQACYGTPQDFAIDLLVEGKVISQKTGNPIKKIKVSVTNNDYQYEYTNGNGEFSFYTANIENLNIKFEDIDATENGSYIPLDTTINSNLEKVFLSISLKEK